MKWSSLLQIPLSLPSFIPNLAIPSWPQNTYPSHPVPLSHLFDNTAAGVAGNFDGKGRSYPLEFLPRGEWEWEGVRYALPASWGSKADNLVCAGQTLDVSGVGYVRELHILYAGDWIDGETTEAFETVFEDGTTHGVQLSVKNWWNLHWLNEGVIKASYHHVTPTEDSYNLTQIHQFTFPLSPLSPLQSIHLPSTSQSHNRLHLFALSYTPALPPGVPEKAKDLVARHARLTSKTQPEAPFAPLLEVTLTSLARSVPNANFPITALHTVHLKSRHFEQLEPGKVYRLAPGDETRVRIPVRWVDAKRDRDETSLPAVVELRDKKGKVRGKWTVDVERRFDREMDTPVWWDDAKFGIFIHWGVFSVPAWAPTGYYAEWYNWWLHSPFEDAGATQKHHLETYGTSLVYDDFIPQFTASKFNATDWIDLFEDAGAKYFVITTKHHDGFAIFDTGSTTHRSSKYLGPQRDLVGELMAAATNSTLRKGTYFSMPEWFSPDYAAYGIDRFPGGLAENPFKPGDREAYTGRLEVKDYLRDVQLAQMRILAQQYGTEIMWCDIGGPNLTRIFAPEWYAQAAKEGRQVTMNNRCGSHASFDTPEFARFSSVVPTSWETSEGIDPYSYGFNRRTLPQEYRSADTIVQTLVDIVSKNGNYLLNLGPDEEGTIIEPMRERLQEAGEWLRHSGECIYGTTYSSLGAELGPLRFTQTPNTFCIISLTPPPSNCLLIPALRQLPILPGDTITLLGSGGDGGPRPLDWEVEEGGGVRVCYEEWEREEVRHAWAFKVEFSER
ncbi:glycoside hydrolase family 29 protein [Calocera cornea HHB12733]|uniref:alpha-L-fucosidase n=1 Tax=Calocera cornea HHB12733 TaxID=1353952 RepID=A0A165EWX3_9BASI|nr:glycoside hydrolase family 29 protein [Calocera cornea HHB12733]